MSTTTATTTAPVPALVSITSPDGRTVATLALTGTHRHVRGLMWRVERDGKSVIAPSPLGLRPEGAAVIGPCMGAAVIDRRTGVEAWSPVCGESAHVEQRFEEVVVRLAEQVPPGRVLHVRLRVFDAGVAVRYERPADDTSPAWPIAAELTGFAFPAGSVGYHEAWPEDTYRRLPVEQLPRPTECPLLVELPSGSGAGVAVVHEAGNRNDGRLYLAAAPHESRILTAELGGITDFPPGHAMPWRVVLLADEPRDLIGIAGQIEALCPPSTLGDASWVRPGKCIREVTLSTAGGIACIDFARAHGMAHILYDACVYGKESDPAADPRTISPDPDRTAKVPNYAGLDLQRVIDYGKQHGVGVWLYVNHQHLERYLDDLLPLYQRWGVAGIKFGFVDTGPARWNRWLFDAIEACAQHKLMADVHDFYRPTGLSRTYPNLLTQEGIRGNEHFPDARHNATLPFARFVGGAGDYTVCYHEPRLKTTAAHQLALAAAFFSPLQLIYWYMKPGDYDPAAMPGMAWFDQVHTTWDRSVGLGGEVGAWAAVARRRGEAWFLGIVNGLEAKDLDIPLDRLGGGRWNAELFTDVPAGRAAVSRCALGGSLALRLPASGGAAAILRPA